MVVVDCRSPARSLARTDPIEPRRAKRIQVFDVSRAYEEARDAATGPRTEKEHKDRVKAGSVAVRFWIPSFLCAHGD